MIKLTVGGIDVSDYVESCQYGKSEESGGNSFTAYNGETVGDIIATVYSVDVTLKELATGTASSLINILNGSGIAVVCDFSGYDGTYECDGGYTVSTSRTDSTGIWWSLKFTLTQRVSGSGSSAGGL